MKPSANTPVASSSSSSSPVSPAVVLDDTAAAAEAEPGAEEIVVPQAISDAAVARMAGRIASLTEADLVAANRDPQRAADIVLKSLPALEAHRGLLETTYKAFDFSRLDSLKDAAYAAKYHNGGAHAAPEGEDVLRAAMDKGMNTRDELLSVVKSLGVRRKMSKTVGDEIVRAVGYSEVAGEITKMVNALRAAWETVAPYAGITKEDVDAALRDADALTEAVAKREKANARFAAGMLLKQQAFSLMVRDYDYVRSALVFPLAQAGKPGPDVFAPSVYVVKKSRKSTPGEAESEETVESKQADDGDEAATSNAHVPQPQPAAPVGPGLGEMTKPFG
jgi:hypothetical protein